MSLVVNRGLYGNFHTKQTVCYLFVFSIATVPSLNRCLFCWWSMELYPHTHTHTHTHAHTPSPPPTPSLFTLLSRPQWNAVASRGHSVNGVADELITSFTSTPVRFTSSLTYLPLVRSDHTVINTERWNFLQIRSTTQGEDSLLCRQIGVVSRVIVGVHGEMLV